LGKNKNENIVKVYLFPKTFWKLSIAHLRSKIDGVQSGLFDSVTKEA
jgi:hypothetical protein